VRLPVPGLYNVYNGLAALTAALELGIPVERAVASLRRATASFGRMERIAMDGRSVLLALVKNPTGYNQVLRTILETGLPAGSSGRRLLLALNDKYADGTDVSWIWDVDFEVLAEPGAQVAGVVASGERAHDLAVRLKYAGVRRDQIQCVPDFGEALDLALGSTPVGETLFITPTYTAMLELRGIISRRGFAPQFWETGGEAAQP